MNRNLPKELLGPRTRVCVQGRFLQTFSSWESWKAPCGTLSFLRGMARVLRFSQTEGVLPTQNRKIGVPKFSSQLNKTGASHFRFPWDSPSGHPPFARPSGHPRSAFALRGLHFFAGTPESERGQDPGFRKGALKRTFGLPPEWNHFEHLFEIVPSWDPKELHRE